MDEYQLNVNKGETVIKAQFNEIQIKQNEFNYDLNIETKENTIYFSMKDKKLPYINYKKSMSLKEIKKLNAQFYFIKSFQDFYDYLKSLSNNNKLIIKKSNNKISIIWNLEVLLKQQSIEIDLFPDKIDLEINIKEIWEELIKIKEKINKIDNLKNEKKEKENESNINWIKNEIDNLKNKEKEKDNKINDLTNKIEELKKEINNLKNGSYEEEINILKNDKNQLRSEIDNLKNENIELIKKYGEINKEIDDIKDTNSDNLITMYGYDKSFIFNEIEKKINKRIKRIKKLYQATIDGGDTINFHNKCDNIPNTLVFIISEGHRRFGGFTPIPWKSKGGLIKDPEMKTFIFSLDDKKIYHLKNKESKAVCHHHERGPCFGGGHDIGIMGNPIKENKLYTLQNSFGYKGGNQSLSEYISSSLKALEYEVFQIIFY